MPKYQAYPTVKDTPNRKQRKMKRKSTFNFNQNQAEIERKARREERKNEKV